MVDLVYLKLAAGDGGDGKVSFLRTRGIMKGGPNGGNGGNGGQVILRASSRRNTLQHYAGIKEFEAEKGEKGRKFHQEGPEGKDLILEVPVGTRVWLVAENEASRFRRQKTGLKRLLKRSEVRHEKYYLEKPTGNPESRENDQVEKPQVTFNDFFNHRIEDKEILQEAIYEDLPEGELLEIKELLEDGEKWVVCQGGFGGLGNDAFKGPTHQTPLEAEYGTFGEQKAVFLEVRLLADIGLVGFPNAGKSTLLSRLTKAKPKVANYPFTTLEPNLGVMSLDREQSLVLADIPGLIEGASSGKGLGFDFLRHIENCKMLVFVLALDEAEIYREDLTVKEKARGVFTQLEKLETELKAYKPMMADKKALIVVNKVDLADEELRAEIKAYGEREGQKLWGVMGKNEAEEDKEMEKAEVVLISGYTGEGLDALRAKLLK